MASVHDVAAYILREQGAMSTWKLQKLVYYSQAWHLVWDDKPLFREPVRAWANGPVVPQLYRTHSGRFEVDESWGAKHGDADVLSHQEAASVDAVLGFYASKSGQWLSELTHRERPWRDARKGVPEGERSNRLIALDAMAEYYGSLP